MRTALWVVLVNALLCGAVCAEDCAPYCGYTHDYGPFDFTYIRPGVYGYAPCRWDGNCAPYLAYSASGYPRGRITIVPRSRRTVTH
jgi:hypothetical protein